MRILITGSRHWSDKARIRRAILEHAVPPCTIVHGGCRGADTMAGEVAAELGHAVEVHVADWDRFGHAAGPLRNIQMVEKGADVVLAFPSLMSKGTRQCIRVARAGGLRVIVHEEEP